MYVDYWSELGTYLSVVGKCYTYIDEVLHTVGLLGCNVNFVWVGGTFSQ